MGEDPGHVATLPPWSPGSMTLVRRPHPAALPSLWEHRLTSGIHLRSGWKQGAQREENGFLLGHSSVPGCCGGGRTGQSQAISTHATSLAPQSPRSRVYSNMRLLAAPT